MALTNAQFALALAAAIDDFHNGVTDEAGLAAAVDPLLDDWALGGASVATAAKLSSDAIASLNTFVEQAVDWYAGTATGGPNSDGLYPLTDTAGNVYSVPSPQKLIADLTGFVPKGHVADVASLPSSGNELGDFYTVAGIADAPNRGYGWSGSAWIDLGEWQGDKGDTGDAATIAVGTVTTGSAGSSAAVENVGTSGAAEFNFTIPRGDTGAAATIAVGTVTTGDAGTSAAVENVGTSGAAEFNFTIPRGDTGAAATIAVGTVTTGAPGSSAAVVNSGTSGAAVFDITIPRGDAGVDGIDGVDGVDGNTILNGSGAPAGGLGADGDFHIDTAANTIYGPKTAGAWGSATSLVGPQGTVANSLQGAWDSGTAYVAGDIVTHGGETWIADQASTNETPAENAFWSKLAAKGADGADGTGGVTWVEVDADGTMTPNQYEISLGNTATRTRNLPSPLVVGQRYAVHAKLGSARMGANGNTIRHKGVAIGGDLLMANGETGEVVADSTSTAEIV